MNDRVQESVWAVGRIVVDASGDEVAGSRLTLGNLQVGPCQFWGIVRQGFSSIYQYVSFNSNVLADV